MSKFGLYVEVKRVIARGEDMTAFKKIRDCSLSTLTKCCANFGTNFEKKFAKATQPEEGRGRGGGGEGYPRDQNLGGRGVERRRGGEGEGYPRDQN
jgi:hypothetical protein